MNGEQPKMVFGGSRPPRLIKVQNENTNGAIGWCLGPTDLAIAKHIAGREPWR